MQTVKVYYLDQNKKNYFKILSAEFFTQYAKYSKVLQLYRAIKQNNLQFHEHSLRRE